MGGAGGKGKGERRAKDVAKGARGAVRRPLRSEGAAQPRADDRFARVQTDPRFARRPRDAARLAAAEDERFAAGPGARGGKRERRPRVDKRGHALPRPAADAAVDSGEESGSTEAASSSDESATETDTDSEESESDEEVAWGEADDSAEAAPLTGEETSRLACCSLDWAHLRAVDLLVMLRSFAPRGGAVRRISVRPTDFGAERMAEEALHGPRALYEDDEDGSNEEEEQHNTVTDDDAKSRKLRKYERERLRYYFALVECDSARTANALYTECDGLEFEGSGNCLDLRFVPDEMRFSRPPRELPLALGGGSDVAKAAPERYKQPNFTTRALQHSNVELTWDNDEPARIRLKKGKFDDDDMEADDLKAYLADTDSGEEEENEEEEGGKGGSGAAGRYRALLDGDNSEMNVFGKAKAAEFAGGGSGGGSGPRQSAFGLNEDKSMELVIDTRLEDITKAALKKREDEAKNADESVWERYLRQKRDKRKARKTERAEARNKAGDGDGMYEDAEGNPIPQHQGDGAPGSGGAVGFDDPFFAAGDEDVDPFAEDEAKAQGKGKGKGKDGKKKRKQREHEVTEGDDPAAAEEARQRRAELEMLLMDDNAFRMAAKGVSPKMAAAVTGGAGDDDEGEDKQRLSRKERLRLKRAKRRAELADDNSDGEADGAGGGGGDFKMDVKDERFGALFSRPEYALDPTAPQFAKAEGVRAAVNARRRELDAQEASLARKKKKKRAGQSASERLAAARQAVAEAEAASKKAKAAGVSSMVTSLKRKLKERGDRY